MTNQKEVSRFKAGPGMEQVVEGEGEGGLPLQAEWEKCWFCEAWTLFAAGDPVLTNKRLFGESSKIPDDVSWAINVCTIYEKTIDNDNYYSKDP